MEILEIFFNAINNHIGDILTISFLLFLTITIASVLFKNKHEYDTIVSDLYCDKRKTTPATIVKPSQTESKYIESHQENVGEESPSKLDEFEEYMKKDGYEVETQRDIKREIASWEDISVERTRGKAKEQLVTRLQEIQQINHIMLEQNKQRLGKDVGQEISKMMQERGRMDAVINIQKNKALGVNSSQSHNKFKKLAEKGKLKVNKHTAVGKHVLKEESTHKKQEKHIQKEKKHENHSQQIAELEEKNKTQVSR